MTLEEIKQAVRDGKRVYWHDSGYELLLDSAQQWVIVCKWNNHTVGLHYADGIRTDYKASDFVISEND